MDLTFLVRPTAVCLVVGALTVLTDYQSAPHWTAALVDGGKVALEVAAAWLGVGVGTGAVQRYQAARAAAPARPPNA